MGLVAALIVVVAVTLLYTLFVRAKDIPPPDPVSPTKHLDERKAAVYENLRDLQFEYRVGKLSDVDYAQTKLALQKELAVVVAETEKMMQGSATLPTKPLLTNPLLTNPAPAKPAPARPAPRAVFTCSHCGAEFAMAMKFCGECGKEMQ